MLRLEFFTVNGHCDNLDELDNYIKNLKELPARIESFIIGEPDLIGINFSITYAPLMVR